MDEPRQSETAPPPLLEVEQLTIELRAGGGGFHRVVEEVSFAIAANETLALVGESGSGKTLTGLAILRLLPPGSRVRGAARWAAEDGTRDLLTLNRGALARIRGGEIGWMPQEPLAALDPRLRVGAQMGETLRFHRRLSRRLSRLEVGREISEVLAELALADPQRCARSYPHQLSGGQRQRAVLAMALLPQPRLLILDEPTTAIDVLAQARLVTLLAQVRRVRGLALLWITHDLGLAAAVADRVAVLERGRLVESGPTREVLARPTHPCTQRLIAAAPTLGGRGEGRSLGAGISEGPRRGRSASSLRRSRGSGA